MGTCLHAWLPKKAVPWSKGYVMFWKWNHITSCGCFINLPHYTLLSITDGEAIHFGLCPKINRTLSTTFINIWTEWEEKCSANEETMLKCSIQIWERITGQSLEDQKLFMEMAIQPLLFRSQLTESQLSSEKCIKHKELCWQKKGQE